MRLELMQHVGVVNRTNRSIRDEDTIGAPTAGDDEILLWARMDGFVLLTHDLDFSAILAAMTEAKA